MTARTLAFTEIVDLAAQEAYRLIADAQRIPIDEVHRHEVCRAASSLILDHILLADNLNLKGVRRLIQPFDNKGGFLAEHNYLVRQPYNNGEIIIDATWQQFIPEAELGQDLPRVLIGSRADVVEFARSASIPEAALDFWKDLASAKTIKREEIWERL